jgi:hypothetical protein
MPVLHVVDSSNRIVITKCTGDVSRDEIAKSLQELREHPDFKPDFNQVSDLSQVSRLNMGFNDMEAIQHLHDPFSKEGKRAVVAPGNGTTFGLARMYQSLVDHENFEVFHSLLDAVAWLGLDGSVITKAMTGKLRRRKPESSVVELPPKVPNPFRALKRRRKRTVG